MDELTGKVLDLQKSVERLQTFMASTNTSPALHIEDIEEITYEKLMTDARFEFLQRQNIENYTNLMNQIQSRVQGEVNNNNYKIQNDINSLKREILDLQKRNMLLEKKCKSLSAPDVLEIDRSGDDIQYNIFIQGMWKFNVPNIEIIEAQSNANYIIVSDEGNKTVFNKMKEDYNFMGF